MARGVLFVHNNFPAQFRDLAQGLVAMGVPVCALGQDHAAIMPGVRTARYSLPRGSTAGIYPLAVRAEADLIRARTAHDAAMALKTEGWDPQVIVGHAGWGEMTYLREVFPDAKQVVFAEFWYRGRGMDVGFDTEFFGPEPESVFRAEAKNAVMGMAYAEADAIVAPTDFQASALPRRFREAARVIHEGVDTDAIRPDPAEPFPLDDGRVLMPGAPVVTHVNNNMEPLRGLHIFARSLPRLMAECPDAHAIVVGDHTKRAYGGAPPDGRSWKEVSFDGLDIDPTRLHFVGRVSHTRMLSALRLGAAHVYYTYPFVLSWSLAEAMASGCHVIASDTPPLHDAIVDGVNGRLLPFFDVDALSDALIAACRDPLAAVPLRAAARETAVAKFDRKTGRAAWIALLQDLGLTLP